MNKKAVFVILSCDRPSKNPDDWQVVPHDKLPPWVIEPEVLGHLVNGNMAMRPDLGERGSPFYRAIVGLKPKEAARLEKAKAARDVREAQHLLLRPASNEGFLVETSELKH